MDETAGGTSLEEQIDGASQLAELSYEPVEGWRDPSEASPGLTQYELGLLHSQMAGHRWHAWRRLNGDEDYFAACSCGWRSTEADSLRPVLDQVKDHLEGVRVSRGYYPSPWAGKPPARDEEQADRRVAGLKHAATHGALERVKTRASAQRAEALQLQLDRAKELRKGIIAAAAALAAIAEEIAWINQDLQSRHPSGAAEHQRMADEARKSAAQARDIERAFSD